MGPLWRERTAGHWMIVALRSPQAIFMDCRLGGGSISESTFGKSVRRRLDLESPLCLLLLDLG